MNAWAAWKSFSENKLPDRCKFFDSLKNRHISEKKYLHAVNVWNTFKMNTMGDYNDLYLKTDAVLKMTKIELELIQNIDRHLFI